MTAKEQGLPALPEPFGSLERTGMWNGSMREGRDDVYDADQMRAYALSALASDTGERGKVVGWWNGQRGEMLDGEPSIRWGANAENTWHDIPLYAGPNPIHALRAQPAGGGEDWQARALAAEADIERMTDAFNRENGPTFMGEPVLPPEKMVELEPGVRVPKWLLDDTRRVELYMKAHLPGSWRIGGIQSHDYANPTPPESGGQEAVAWMVEYVRTVSREHAREIKVTKNEVDRLVHALAGATPPMIAKVTALYTHPPAQASKPMGLDAMLIANAITKQIYPDLYGKSGLSTQQVAKLMGARGVIYDTITAALTEGATP